MTQREIKPFAPSMDKPKKLLSIGSWPESVHRFDKEQVLAVKTAMAAERPLLVLGEPGVGKSQLARAVAAELEWPFLYHVVNARSEHSDLLYYYDAVSRLAQAQIFGSTPPNKDEEPWKKQLEEVRFVRPGVLWWAFDWNDARKQAKCYCRDEECSKAGDACCKACGEPEHPKEGDGEDDWAPGKGCVVLVDEIDKAETDLPNGLLESFANNGFHVPHSRCDVRLNGKTAPLLMVTTNEDRDLPAAFIRRCVVLRMTLPTEDHAFQERLVELGKDHCSDWISVEKIDGDEKDQNIYQKAATQLLNDRKAAIRDRSPVKPGLAEYLDLLYVLSRLHPKDTAKQASELEAIQPFVFAKYKNARQGV